MDSYSDTLVVEKSKITAVNGVTVLARDSELSL